MELPMKNLLPNMTGLKVSSLVLVGAFLSMLAVVTTVYAQTAPTVAAYTPPPEGTAWSTETTSADGSKKTNKFVVISDREPFRNREVFRVSSGSLINIRHLANGSWAASQDLNTGDLIRSAFPHVGNLKWPMKVGNKWKASFKFEDHKQGKSRDPVETNWEVVGYEDITVPAGTYKAFVLQSKPGRNNGTTVRARFAPKLGIEVKREFARGGAHYRGSARNVTVLTSYERQ